MQIRMDEKGRSLFMATYVISDIHGEYERFMELLEEIELKDTDTLQDQIRFYVAGNFSELSCHAKNQPQKPFRKTVADALPSTFSESHR